MPDLRYFVGGGKWLTPQGKQRLAELESKLSTEAPPSTPEQRALALWDKIDEHVCRGGCASDWLEVDTEKAVALIAYALREERALALENAAKHVCGFTKHKSRSDDGDGEQIEDYVSVSVLLRLAAEARQGK